MQALQYRARTVTGETIEGEIRAESEKDARQTLSDEGLVVLEVSAHTSRLPQYLRKLPLPTMRPIRLAALAALTGQLALMLRTGTSLVEALDALCEQAEDESRYNVLLAIQRDVNAGKTLAYALEAHPRVFDAYYVSAVRAGEASGTMPQVFARLEAAMEKRLEIRAALATALIYPAIVTGLACCAIVFVMTFVLPRFVDIFEQSGVALPLPTRMLMVTSYAMVTYWYLFLLAAIILPAGLYFAVTSRRGARIVDTIMLALPVVGPLSKTLQTATVLRTLGTLLAAGVPLTEALDVARDACKNCHFRELVQEVTRAVTQGEHLAKAFSHSPLLAPATKQMIATGERTGALSLVMNALADHLDNQAQKQLKKLSATFEPLMIVLMGLLIGFIAVSVLLPLFRLTQTVRGA